MAEFPDLLINPNPNAPTLDASGNQVRGINFFDTTAERDALNITVRTLGALAVIKGSDELYQYTADTVDDTAWQNESNWLGIGSAGGSGVQNVNNLDGNITLVGSGSVTITDDGNSTITIDSTGGGGATEGINVSFIVRDTPYANTGDHEGTVTTLAGLTPIGTGLVNYWNGGAWIAANASSVASSAGLIGLSTGVAGAHLTDGIMQLGSVPGSAGDVLYLDTTNGLLTNDISGFTTGQVVRVMGYNLGGNKVCFDPSNDWIEIS